MFVGIWSPIALQIMFIVFDLLTIATSNLNEADMYLQRDWTEQYYLIIGHKGDILIGWRKKMKDMRTIRITITLHL